MNHNDHLTENGIAFYARHRNLGLRYLIFLQLTVVLRYKHTLEEQCGMQPSIDRAA